MMPCTGHCLGIAPVVLPPQPEGSDEKEYSAAAVSEPTETYRYTHLKPWQTRVLRLHPSNCPSDGREVPLSADLLVVTVSDAEDFLVESTGATIEYTALSYSWGRPVLSKTLICNGMGLPISGSNAAALVALRDPTEPTYLWIDAICINQEDALEKSAQVSRMLKIYEKAQSVAVWLGEPDADSLLAFASIHGITELQEEVSKFGETTHVPLCWDRMKSIFGALLSLYNRPWLRRTWVRQEIFGARRLVIHCGSQQTSWDGFVGAADMMKMIRALMKNEVLVSENQHTQYSRLLTEAVRNASLPPTGVKPPRQLAEVLLEARYFQAKDPKDTFYAVLGMCNVVAFSKETAQRRQEWKGAVLVDYEKPLVEIYHDATLCILHGKGEPDILADLWHSYRRSPLHTEGLPTWAIDWQSGTLEHDYRATLRKYFQSEFSRTPLKLRDQTNGQHTTPDEALENPRAWYWPEPLHSDAKLLRLRARVLNYVAYLTDFTCGPEKFARTSYKCLGLTALAIHGKKMLRDPLVGRAIVYPHPEWVAFDPETHSWRLAVLGVGNSCQVCLVPSTTRKGDLIVAIAPDLLAMVISPIRSDGTATGLFEQHDPYEDITKAPLRESQFSRTAMFLCGNSILMLMPFTVAFLTSSHYLHGSFAVMVSLACYCPVLLVLILGYVVMQYWCALHRLIDSRLLLSHGLFAIQCLASPFILLTLGSVGTAFVFSYIGAAVAIALIGPISQVLRQSRFHKAIASRRINVFKSLDCAAETLGRDFEFHGPAMIRYNHVDLAFTFGKHSTIFSLRIQFAIAFLLNFRFQDRQRIRANYLEMLSSVEENFHKGKTTEFAWKRPIQEFRLH